MSIIRGLDPAHHSPEDNLTLFLALSDFIGDVKGVQNRNGDMISGFTLIFRRVLSKNNAVSRSVRS